MALVVRGILMMLMVASSAQGGRVHRNAHSQASTEAADESARIKNKLNAGPWKAVAGLLLMANPAAAFKPGAFKTLGRAFGSSGTTTASGPVAEVPARARGVSMLVSRLSKDENEFNKFCYGLPGSTAPFGEFDPAGFANGASKADVYRLREAELTHGRVGMLAAAGFLVQENFHPLFNGVNGPAIDQIPQLPPALWFGMTLGIGICEAVRIQKGWANPYEGMENVQALKEGYYPGDLGFDPLGLKPDDPEELREMQNKELNNGRLGMVAAAGFLAQEAVSGTTWGANLQP